MSEQGAVQSSSPGLLIKSSVKANERLNGASGQSIEALGPFARHLSDARAQPVEQNGSRPVGDGRTAVREGDLPANTGKKTGPDSEPFSSGARSSVPSLDGLTDKPAPVPTGHDVADLAESTALDSDTTAQRSPVLDVSPNQAKVTARPQVSISGEQINESVLDAEPHGQSPESPSASTLPVMGTGSAAQDLSDARVVKPMDTSTDTADRISSDLTEPTDAPANHFATDIDRGRQAGAHRVDVSEQSPVTPNMQAIQPPVANAMAQLDVATPATTMSQAGNHLRGVGVRPLLAREMSQRATGSVNGSLAHPAVDSATSPDSSASMTGTRFSVPVTMNAVSEEQLALQEGPVLNTGRVKAIAGALQTPGLAASLADGQAVGSTSAAETSAINLPTNMFHAVASGTLTAALGSRMDAGATPQLAPHVVHLQMGHGDGSLSENVRWVVDNNLRNVTVNVTPSGMGPVSINVVMESEQMNVSIVANQGATREALEAALPRLREQLVQQGNEQVRVDVSDGRSGQSGQGRGQHPADDERAHTGRSDAGSSTETANEHSTSTGRDLMCGLVDAYA